MNHYEYKHRSLKFYQYNRKIKLKVISRNVLYKCLYFTLILGLLAYFQAPVVQVRL